MMINRNGILFRLCFFCVCVVWWKAWIVLIVFLSFLLFVCLDIVTIDIQLVCSKSKHIKVQKNAIY